MSGSLPPGTYKLCFTAITADGRMSGNGPITTVKLTTEGRITISNTDSYIVWMTDTNGSEFYYAGIVGSIVHMEDVDLLPSLFVRPPKPMEHLTFWNSKVWGAIGSDVFHSEPFAYEWFKDENFLPMTSNIKLITAIPSGLYIASENSTWFYDRNQQLTLIDNVGAVPNTLTRTSFTKLGQDVPVWVTQKGIVAGAEGRLVYLTSERIKFDVGSIGASVFTRKGGVAKFMTSMAQPTAVAFGDSVTAEVIRNGKVFAGAEFQRTEQDDVVFSEVLNDDLDAELHLDVFVVSETIIDEVA